jgi:UDP-glucose 4-epimerase
LAKSPSELANVLITGGAGFIGSHLAEALLDRGYGVHIIDDLSTGAFENIEHLTSHRRFRFAIDTVLDETVLDRVISQCEVVFHLAAAVGVELIIRDPIHVIETNVLGTQAVLKIASRYQRKVLPASSSEIYGKSEAVPFREESDRLLGPTTRARWSYSTSKAVEEYLGLAYHGHKGLPVVIFRPFNTIGPRQTGRYGMVVPRFVGQAIAGESLRVYGDGSQRRSFCDVRDMAVGMISLMEHPQAVGEVFNLGSWHEVSILELARTVLSLVEGESGASEERIAFVPHDEAYAPGFEDMSRRQPDLTKIQRLIGWQAETPLEQTLRAVIADQRRR